MGCVSVVLSAVHDGIGLCSSLLSNQQDQHHHSTLYTCIQLRPTYIQHEHGLTQFCFPPLSRTLPFLSVRHIGTPPPSECDLLGVVGIERGRGLLPTVENRCLKLLMCTAFVAREVVLSYIYIYMYV